MDEERERELDRRINSIGQKSTAPQPPGAGTFLLIICLFIAGMWWFMTGGADPRISSGGPSKADQDGAWAAAMQIRVRDSLKDPGSAQFSRVRTYHGSGTPVVCGYVNSKNSLGAMSGSQRFVASGSVIALSEQMQAGEMDRLWGQLCR